MGPIAAESRWKSAILSRIRTLETLKLIKNGKKNFLASLGFDLGTFGLQNQCSTTELQGLFIRIHVCILNFKATSAFNSSTFPEFEKFQILQFL